MIAVTLAAAAEAADTAAEAGPVTPQQAIGIVVALIVVAGWGLYALSNMRRARAELGSEIELAANRKPYLDDEQLEGPRLERALTWGLVSLAIIGVGLPLYWLAEPGRQAGAIEYMRERREGTTYMHGPGSEPVGGGALYASTEEGGFNCAGCHGGYAGAPVPATFTEPDDGSLREIEWWAPSLDDVTLRMSDDQLRDVLTYGRPHSPMPAWGIEGGGPMTTQQIDNIILHLHSVAISAEEARSRNDGLLETELTRLEEEGDEQVEGFDAEGVALFNVHCARCHTNGYSWGEPGPPGAGFFGPSVYNSLDQFPDAEDHVDFVSREQQYGDQYGVGGIASGRMPYFGNILTEDQIEAIVEYERALAERYGPDGADAPSTAEPEEGAGQGPGAPAGAGGQDGATGDADDDEENGS